ncbi:MAG: hypothetical protein ABL934_09735 [Lysobacteraceae bacterium]
MHAKPARNVTCTTYSDEYIQRWSDAYVERRVHDYGVHLEFFLINPQNVLDSIDSGRLLRLDQMSPARSGMAGAR